MKRPRREASFVDCSAEFTKSGRVVSIVIALPCDMPGVIPDAVDGAPLPLPGICRVVNPRIPERPSRTNLPVSAAALHTVTTSLLSTGMLLRKHATCRRRLQVPNRIGRKNAKKACPLSHTIGPHDARASVPVRESVGGADFSSSPGGRMSAPISAATLAADALMLFRATGAWSVRCARHASPMLAPPFPPVLGRAGRMTSVENIS